MVRSSIYEDIAKRTKGDIYIGVVGPVRTGKSTFIKRFMEEMVLPNIADEDARARARDELPQSASGKTVMTAEPKFIPERGAHLKTAGGLNMNLRMVDCVGFPVEGALGAEENGEARLVNTPWSEEKMEFSAAARLGTEKVMREHSTVGVVVSTDGSIGELPRAFEMGMGEDAGAYFEDAVTDLGTGEATVRLRVPTEKYFEVLSSLSGTKIANDAELFDAFCSLAKAKKEYDRVAGALADVERKGYGIVMPDPSELHLDKPEIVRKGSSYAVHLKASAPSIHLMRANIETELSPIVGDEQQSDELIKYLLGEYEGDTEKLWQSNIFGKSLYDLVTEGLNTKIQRMPEDARQKLTRTLARMINENTGGMICILL